MGAKTPRNDDEHASTARQGGIVYKEKPTQCNGASALKRNVAKATDANDTPQEQRDKQKCTRHALTWNLDGTTQLTSRRHSESEEAYASTNTRAAVFKPKTMCIDAPTQQQHEKLMHALTYIHVHLCTCSRTRTDARRRLPSFISPAVPQQTAPLGDMQIACKPVSNLLIASHVGRDQCSLSGRVP